MVSESILRAAAYVPKGGVGKTTSTAHIAVSAHQDHDLDVLLIDLAGTQNDLATQFGIADEIVDPDAPISAVFGENWDFIRENIDDLLERMVFETDEGPDLIPADEGLGGADNNLANVPREERYDRLESFISTEIAPRYDLVLLDLPGKEDNITINGLFAAENVVAPLKPGAFERKQVANLEDELEAIRNDADHDAQPTLQLVFATMIEKGTNLSKEFQEEIEAEYPDVAGNSVTKAQDIGNLQKTGQTLFGPESDELYSTGERALNSYQSLATDLLERLEAR
ncbi:ParA family protein [Natronolimnobius sp. AArcel1]|uniref:ParA family protein n=1 Tax=Natronolimnobius sp. AArcel1 TaxID=1679093 RepID=UPI0013ED9BF7|nr:ParA family protein [Natronolimnobius sp. AArcel1]NGM71285.1 ParA family protein [Natronolimnobius sp. AArcel1]